MLKYYSGCKVIILYFLLLLGAESLFAQDYERLERRIDQLERRVNVLEKNLNKNTKTSVSKIEEEVTDEKYVYYPLDVQLFKRELERAGSGGDDADYLALLLIFKNRGRSDISSFKGDVIFCGLQGDTIFTFTVDINKYIPAYKEKSWYGGVVYNSQKESHRKLMYCNKNDLRTSIRLNKIYFTDGTKKQ